MKNKVLYLILLLCSGVGGAVWMAHLCERALINENKRAERYVQNFNLSCDWIRILQDGRGIKEYFEKYPTNSVAIYGMGELGKCLKDALQKAGVPVAYLIDRDKKKWCGDIPAFDMQDELPKVERIIVTPIWDYNDIKEEIDKKIQTEVVSLKTVIEEIQKDDYKGEN